MDLQACQLRAEKSWLEQYDAGPRNTRWTRVPLQVGDPAPDANLPDHEGTPRQLSDAWSGGVALVLFWRQFGCGCGIERASRLREELTTLEGAGANVVIVGQGAPVQAREYRDRHGLELPVLLDPARDTYAAYGLLEGAPEQFYYDATDALLNQDPAAAKQLVDERRELGRPMVDSPWQLPGEFVIDRAGVVQLAYRYQYCEDFPDPRLLTATIARAGRASHPGPA